MALCDLYNCAVDSDTNTVFNLFPRKVAASAATELALLRKDGFFHVLLPSKAETVDLPGFMCMPPQIVEAVFREDPAIHHQKALQTHSPVKLHSSGCTTAALTRMLAIRSS